MWIDVHKAEPIAQLNRPLKQNRREMSDNTQAAGCQKELDLVIELLVTFGRLYSDVAPWYFSRVLEISNIREELGLDVSNRAKKLLEEVRSETSRARFWDIYSRVYYQRERNPEIEEWLGKSGSIQALTDLSEPLTQAQIDRIWDWVSDGWSLLKAPKGE